MECASVLVSCTWHCWSLVAVHPLLIVPCLPRVVGCGILTCLLPRSCVLCRRKVAYSGVVSAPCALVAVGGGTRCSGDALVLPGLVARGSACGFVPVTRG
ncbi:hypothetical protein TRVL_09369 [Trypanosoma vivax]|nr:hypothetical protein TRVL_09369 [Trypanosoma vivax]